MSPINDAIMDNSCGFQLDLITWAFDWSDCPGATAYNLYVIYPGALNPIIDATVTASEYIFSITGTLSENARVGWTWKVRALINGVWGGWSQEGIFNVEPLNTDCSIDPVTDIEGNVYKTVAVGTQVWMAENLKTTKYNDGTAIPLVTEWNLSNEPAYCWYNSDANIYKDTYGALYNWYALNSTTNGSKNACPTGWHVPSDEEWTILTDYLGGKSVAGGKIKETGTSHWLSPNTGATNESGFTGLPTGYRNYSGGFNSIGRSGYWWTSTEWSSTGAWYRDVYFEYYSVDRSNSNKKSGATVRCIKD